jgi:hypothetical protein
MEGVKRCHQRSVHARETMDATMDRTECLKHDLLLDVGDGKFCEHAGAR